MDSLSDRLKSLGFKPTVAIEQPQMDQQMTLEQAIDGVEVVNSAGSFIKKDQIFAWDYQHGNVKFTQKIDTKTLQHSSRIDYAPDALQRMLFIDTETSGLSGGAGTFAFLIGIGRFKEDGFLLEQLIIHDPSEEMAMLLHLADMIKPDTIFVSFNGKSFDIPLVQNRLVLNKLPVFLRDLAHVDILHISRKLWRKTLPSCTLKDLEVAILGFPRSSEDVPGWMIPDIYFEYLRTHDPSKLSDVIYHNAQDIVSLAALMIHISRLFEFDQSDEDISTDDLLAISKVYWDLGSHDIAEKGAQLVLTRELTSGQLLSVNAMLGQIHKVKKCLPEALTHWEIAALQGDPYTCVELAKYYEHKRREYLTALQWCEMCTTILEQKPKTVVPLMFRRDLERRITRLQMKGKNNVHTTYQE
jgi:hypothetical protein